MQSAGLLLASLPSDRTDLDLVDVLRHQNRFAKSSKRLSRTSARIGCEGHDGERLRRARDFVRLVLCAQAVQGVRTYVRYRRIPGSREELHGPRNNPNMMKFMENIHTSPLQKAMFEDPQVSHI